MRTPTILCSLLFAVQLLAQDLRHGLIDADIVVVGREVNKSKHNDDLELHRLQVISDIRGASGNTAVTVLDWPRLGLHQRPSPRQSRLYCLQDASAVATRLGLPSAQGPYYKMVGWAGSSPLVGADLTTDATVQFARLLARGEAGARPVDTANELSQIALTGAPVVRTEAARLLTERGDLRGLLTPLEWSQLLTRASGEIDDVSHKIALAELCAEQRLDGLLDTLAISLGQVTDPEYARTVGRIGKLLHGEAATAILQQRMSQLREPKDRAVVLLAIGATNTESALDALLRMNEASSKNAAVEAALKEHRSPRAKEAVAHKK
jgi:hypothetical protein